MHELYHWTKEAENHVHTFSEYTGQAEWPVKYLGEDADVTRGQIRALGAAAVEAANKLGNVEINVKVNSSETKTSSGINLGPSPMM